MENKDKNSRSEHEILLDIEAGLKNSEKKSAIFNGAYVVVIGFNFFLLWKQSLMLDSGCLNILPFVIMGLGAFMVICGGIFGWRFPTRCRNIFKAKS